MGAQPPVSRVARFLAEARRASPPVANGGHRMIFALDATASREPTWDLAMGLHGELFDAVSEAEPERSGARVQLAYYRGYNEFHASPWSSDAASLLARMTGVRCRGGMTQIRRLLEHAIAETGTGPVKAVIFIGDACEEPIDAVAGAAGRLAMFRTPVFLFQEGADPDAARAFRQVARITGGAHLGFAAGGAAELRILLGAAARYATSGRAGVERIDHPAVRRLLRQLP